MINKVFISIKTNFQIQKTQTVISTQELEGCYFHEQTQTVINTQELEGCYFHESFLKNLLDNELQTAKMNMLSVYA